jgi:hypothetical protein
MNNLPHHELSIGYIEQCVKERVNTKCIGLQIDNHLKWKNPVDQMIPKLCGTCYAVRSVVHISNINTLKSIYIAYFHSIGNDGIIFWGNLSNSAKIFTLQNKML